MLPLITAFAGKLPETLDGLAPSPRALWYDRGMKMLRSWQLKSMISSPSISAKRLSGPATLISPCSWRYGHRYPCRS